ncbi:hypothetical protein B296_00018293, partial [Ensete ventricosum]
SLKSGARLPPSRPNPNNKFNPSHSDMIHSVFASPSSSSASFSIATTNHRCYHRCKTHPPLPSLPPFPHRPPPPSPSLSSPRRLAASAAVRCTSGLLGHTWEVSRRCAYLR